MDWFWKSIEKTKGCNITWQNIITPSDTGKTRVKKRNSMKHTRPHTSVIFQLTKMIRRMKKMRKEKFPTQMRSTHKLIICSRNCTQHRTKSFRLSEKKTFDPIKGKCNNCTFKTVPAGAVFHGPGFKRASDFPKVKAN